ncbi:hypothetical protein M5689_011438 [Euphorbia peplus]|nr:hypothetical protein M5689_011438 [Euphorbia peplus]
MSIIGDALRQAFMPKHDYENQDRAWIKIQRPIFMSCLAVISLVILVCIILSLKIVFPGDNSLRRPFCSHRGPHPPPRSDSDLIRHAFYLTDQETVDYYWIVVFVPSAVIFFASIPYLCAGIAVAYSAPTRHGCLKVVENNYCASRRGGVRCISILNVVFAVIFGVLALFLGSSLLTLGSRCSLPLFWCYEIATWGLVILYGGTAFFLRRKRAMILDESDFSSRNHGLEMLEANPVEVTPEVERRVNEGFKAWMGSSLLSSDDEDEPDNSNLEVPRLSRTTSNR